MSDTMSDAEPSQLALRSRKDLYLYRIEAQGEAWQAQLVRWEARALVGPEELRAAYQLWQREFRDKLADAQRKLALLRASAEEPAEPDKAVLETLWTDLKTAIHGLDTKWSALRDEEPRLAQ